MSTGESARPDTTLRVSLVADFYRRYPGEPVTFSLRVDAGEAIRRFKLQLWLPVGLVVDSGAGRQAEPPLIGHGSDGSFVIWRARAGERDADDAPPAERDSPSPDQVLSAPARGDGVRGQASGYEYEVRAHLAVPDPVHPPVQAAAPTLDCQALVTAKVGDEELSDQETVSIAVESESRFLTYLPAIYRDDDLMGRFLMLFESFWKPVEQQIDVLELYFDPRFCPPSLLPWLASWIDLVLDERWPEEKRRRLLHAAVGLYRKRGTRPGLEEYLEIYTGHKPRIIEHRAHNFRLGPEARLGPGVALGTINVPHTFTVILRLPALAHVRGKAARVRQEEERRKRIEGIIAAEKPAHTNYVLRIEEEG